MAPTETLAEQHFRTLETLLATAAHTGRAAHLGDASGVAAASCSTRWRPAAAARRRHPRADRVGGRVLLAGGRGGRRAAPLRGQPARRARREGPRRAPAPRAPHDRHADPADALADRLRRPRHHGAARAAQRAGGRSGPGSSTRSVAPRPTSSSASGCARGARPTSSARWSRDSEAIAGEGGRGGGEAARRRPSCRDFRVELLHGQMSSERKAAARCRPSPPARREVLVATTVIEVGIDVANATVMLVEGAERFGLSQLHQLRGRVGRGEHESFCILFGDPESDAAEGATRRDREPRRTASRSPRSTSRSAARARSSAPASTACRASAPRRCPRTRRCCSRPAGGCWSCASATARSRRRRSAR